MVSGFKAGGAVVAVAVLTTASSVWGFGWYCASYDQRVTSANTIVLGRTARTTTDEYRPTLYAVTYEFFVEQVLKGDRYKVGDTIVHRDESQLLSHNPFPGESDGPHLLFVNLAESGREYFGYHARLTDVDLDAIKRQIRIQADPAAFFKSEDEEVVNTILDWIRRTYVRYDKKGGLHADWSDKSVPNRDTIIQYLMKHARGDQDDLSVIALSVLENLRASEAFEMFLTALQSKTDGDKVAIAARGLQNLGDKRAVPRLFDRWTELRRQRANWASSSQAGAEATELKIRPSGWHGRRAVNAPEQALFEALLSFDDPRMKQVILDSLSGSSGWWAMSYMSHADDPRAVEPLLRSLWQGNSAAIEQLKKYDDDRIAEEGRERLYDHPLAPQLLARRGDPSVREFMVRLVQQGFWEGFTWVAATQDESVKADVVGAVTEYSGTTQYHQRVGYALGRLRAFDMVASVLERDLADVDIHFFAAEMLCGLSDFDLDKQDDCPRGEQDNCLGQSLWDVAQREGWTASERELARELLAAFKNREQSQDRYCLNWYPARPWFPPDSLPDMPDPLDKEATRAYLEKNEKRWRRVFEEGSYEDMNKVLVAAQNCEMQILDNELAVRLLTKPDWVLNNHASYAMRKGEVTLTTRDIERWALTGGFESTRRAIAYIAGHPKPEYAPIVTKVFLRGRHLFVDVLFKAIIKTNATGCTDLLRAYLENEHYALRLNAAVTLIHLGDDAGKAVLAELRTNWQSCTRCLGGEFLQEAIEQLN